MGKRQQILNTISNAVRSVIKKDDDVAYGIALSKMKVRLKHEVDNEHDPYAVLVQVWSKKKKKWYGIGYVPRKITMDSGDKKIALCEVITKMLRRDMIDKATIDYIGTFNRFDDGVEKVITYCKVTVHFRTS
jgi:hypothetical protein